MSVVICVRGYTFHGGTHITGTPVVQKPINANPRLKINQGVSLLLNVFKADIRQNYTIEEVNLEKQK